MFKKYFSSKIEPKSEEVIKNLDDNKMNQFQKDRNLELLSNMDEDSLSNYMQTMKMALKNQEVRDNLKKTHGFEIDDSHMKMMEQFLTPKMMKESLQYIKNKDNNGLSQYVNQIPQQRTHHTNQAQTVETESPFPSPFYPPQYQPHTENQQNLPNPFESLKQKGIIMSLYENRQLIKTSLNMVRQNPDFIFSFMRGRQGEQAPPTSPFTKRIIKFFLSIVYYLFCLLMIGIQIITSFGGFLLIGAIAFILIKMII
jgi:hypothetical protein